MATPLTPITSDESTNSSTPCCEPACCTPAATRQPAAASTDDAVREDVRERYAARARAVTGSGGSCCTPSGDTSTVSSGLYSMDELSDITEDAASASLGCGNPTAIASLRPGETVLDLGSGGGIDVFLAARQVGPDGFVYGVDMTDEMLDLARRNAERQGATNVEFRKGQIEEIPLEEQTVDVIISNCVINLSPDKGQVLRDAFRVLKPGGRLAVSDIVVDGTLDDLPVSEAQVRSALSWAGCVAGALTVDDYRALLAEAGFERGDVEIAGHYSLESLGQDAAGAQSLGLTAEQADDLARRFASGSITGYRPL